MKKEENTEKTELFTKEFISNIQDVSKQLNQIVILVERLGYAISKLTGEKEKQVTQLDILQRDKETELFLEIKHTIQELLKEEIGVNTSLIMKYNELLKKVNN
jgi:hypothetical protein